MSVLSVTLQCFACKGKTNYYNNCIIAYKKKQKHMQ